jgi:phosphoribosylamine-glycine ligase
MVLSPLQNALDSKLLDFKGVLFIGLMMTPVANRFIPNVLEFNARFGDPETQTLMPLLESDLLELLWSCANEKLSDVQPRWAPKYSCCVIAAHQGYPDTSSKDKEITIGTLPDKVVVFQAGTKQDGAKLLSNGGRVLCLTAVASSIKVAVAQAYDGMACVHFEQMDYRKDIAGRALNECLSI